MSRPTAVNPRAGRRRPRGARAPCALSLLYRGCRRFLGVSIALFLMMVYLTITQDSFLTSTNLTNILRSMAVLFMVSIGNTFVLLTAGFDLSVGSMLSLGGVALAGLLGAGMNPWLAVLLTLMLCTALGGGLNGVLIGKAGLSFFVVTLATLSLLRGAVFVYTEGKTERVHDDVVASIGDGKLGGLSIPVLLMIAVFVISLLVVALHAVRPSRIRRWRQQGSRPAVGDQRRDGHRRRVRDLRVLRRPGRDHPDRPSRCRRAGGRNRDRAVGRGGRVCWAVRASVEAAVASGGRSSACCSSACCATDSA